MSLLARLRNPSAVLRPGPRAGLAGDEAGAVAIEVAAATPFLVLLVAGLVEYGTMLYRVQLMQAGVRDAARYLASIPGLPTAAGEAKAAAETRARQLAVTGSITGGSPKVPDWRGDATGVRIVYEAVANARDATTGLRRHRGDDTVYVVQVTGAMTYAGIGLLNALGLGPVPMSATHEERHVAP